LHNHALLARERGIAECRVIENGEVAVLDAGRLHHGGRVPTRAVAVDRVGNELDAALLRDRTLLGQSGVVRVHLAIDAEGALASPVRLEGRGVAGFASLDAQLRREIERVVRQRSKAWQLRGLDPSSELQRFVSFRLGRALGQRPLVDALIDRG
jgi:mRNA degradation ribonuclease J1/J2